MWLFKKLDWWLLAPAMFLISLGLIMILSLGSRSLPPYYWFFRQLLWLGIGIVVLVASALVDYRIFRNSTLVTAGFYSLSLFLLGLVLIFGKTIRGSQAWFNIGSFTFQPVEFAKIALLLLLAKYFSQKNIEIWRFRHIIVSGLWTALPIALLILQPDWGSGLIFIGLWLSSVILAGARPRHVVLIVMGLAILGLVGWQTLITPSQKERVLAWLQPQRDPYGTAYSQRQALIAIGSGGLLGKGLGEGTQAQLKFLPAARTDFIFAALAEELGFLGIMVLLSAFGLLFWRMTNIGQAVGNNFARIFSLGFLILIASHVFINLGMNLGILPVIGIVLPFVSYGGSSLVSLALGLGILLSMKIHSA